MEPGAHTPMRLLMGNFPVALQALEQQASAVQVQHPLLLAQVLHAWAWLAWALLACALRALAWALAPQALVQAPLGWALWAWALRT